MIDGRIEREFSFAGTVMLKLEHFRRPILAAKGQTRWRLIRLDWIGLCVFVYKGNKKEYSSENI